MEFSALQEGTLVTRYKRFLADVRLESGETLTVHCANSGAMTACSQPGRPVLISDSSNPKRKLRFTWEMIHMGEAWVGVNTANPNRAVAGYIQAGQVPELNNYITMRREVAYGRTGNSRIDLLLQRDGARCFVEVKNATMRVGRHAAFPDAVSLRGQKHLMELMHVAAAGERAVLFFFVGRDDCHRVRPADEVDPAYGRLLRQAAGCGVEILAYQVSCSPQGMALRDRLPVDL